ncbi:MAG: hypothetical protein HOP02_05130 [Methylococcaceae bacterium]|nr:hypothetical protein [Methylococcaceae bacterium]
MMNLTRDLMQGFIILMGIWLFVSGEWGASSMMFAIATLFNICVAMKPGFQRQA